MMTVKSYLTGVALDFEDEENFRIDTTYNSEDTAFAAIVASEIVNTVAEQMGCTFDDMLVTLKGIHYMRHEQQ